MNEKSLPAVGIIVLIGAIILGGLVYFLVLAPSPETPAPATLESLKGIDLYLTNADKNKESGDIAAERLNLMDALDIALKNNIAEKIEIIETKLSDNSRRGGDSQRRSKNYDAAEKSYKDAIDYGSDNPWAYVGLIIANEETGDHETAVDYIKVLDRIEPTGISDFPLDTKTAEEYNNYALTFNNKGISVAQTAETIGDIPDAIAIVETGTEYLRASLAISGALDAAGIEDTHTTTFVTNLISAENNLILLNTQAGDLDAAINTANETLEIIQKYQGIAPTMIPESEVIASLYENQITYIKRTTLSTDIKASLISHLTDATDAIRTGDVVTFTTSIDAYMAELDAVDNPQALEVSSDKPGGFVGNSLYCKDLCDHHLKDGNAPAYAVCWYSCMACFIDKSTTASVPNSVSESAALAGLYENQIDYIKRTTLSADIKASLISHLTDAADAIRTGDMGTFTTSIDAYMAELDAIENPQTLKVSSDKPGGFVGNSLYCKDLCDHHLKDGNAPAYAVCWYSCMACFIDKSTTASVSEGIIVSDAIISSVLSNTATVYILSGDYNTAIKYAETSLVHNPDSAAANNVMGVSLATLGGEGNVINALTYTQKAAELDPENAIYKANLDTIQDSIANGVYEDIELDFRG